MSFGISFSAPKAEKNMNVMALMKINYLVIDSMVCLSSLSLVGQDLGILTSLRREKYSGKL
jgi:hypothetical protein